MMKSRQACIPEKLQYKEPSIIYLKECDVVG